MVCFNQINVSHFIANNNCPIGNNNTLIQPQSLIDACQYIAYL